jgi:hypothetical protein
MTLPSRAVVRFHVSHFPAQNPAFNPPDYPLIRFAGGTPAEAHLQHPE